MTKGSSCSPSISSRSWSPQMMSCFGFCWLCLSYPSGYLAIFINDLRCFFLTFEEGPSSNKALVIEWIKALGASLVAPCSSLSKDKVLFLLRLLIGRFSPSLLRRSSILFFFRRVISLHFKIILASGFGTLSYFPFGPHFLSYPRPFWHTSSTFPLRWSVHLCLSTEQQFVLCSRILLYLQYLFMSKYLFLFLKDAGQWECKKAALITPHDETFYPTQNLTMAERERRKWESERWI